MIKPEDPKIISLAENFKTYFVDPKEFKGNIDEIISNEDRSDLAPEIDVNNVLLNILILKKYDRPAYFDSFNYISEMFASAALKYINDNGGITSKEMTLAVRDYLNGTFKKDLPILKVKGNLLSALPTKERKKVGERLIDKGLYHAKLSEICSNYNFDYLIKGITSERFYFSNENSGLDYLEGNFIELRSHVKKNETNVKKPFVLPSTGEKVEGERFDSWEDAENYFLSLLVKKQRDSIDLGAVKEVLENAVQGGFYKRTMEAFIAKSNFNPVFKDMYFKK